MQRIQFLDGMNGMPVAMLDGTGAPVLRTAEEYHGFYTRNHDAKTDTELDTIANGLDLAGFKGDGSVSDSEKVRAYIIRTKRIADRNPELLVGYQNPKEFSAMLGYVLGAWDTADRETAIIEMADREAKLIGNGSIKSEEADFSQPKADEDVFDSEDMQVNGLGEVRLNKNKNGFFSHLERIMTNAQLPKDARRMAAVNPFIDKKKNAIRAAIAKSRRTRALNTLKNGVRKTITQTVAGESLSGIDDKEFNEVMNGTALLGIGALGSTETADEAYRNYLIQTKSLIMKNPQEYADDSDDLKQMLGVLNYAIDNYNNDRARRLLTGDGMTEAQHLSFLGLADDDDDDELADGALGKSKKKSKKAAKKKAKKEKKAAKKAKRKEKRKKRRAKIKKFFKKVGQGIKKAAKAVGKALKKVAKFLVRFNPLTILIRAGIRVAFRLNMFKMAIKAFPAIATDEELAQYGFTVEDRDKAKKEYKKMLKLFKGIGGKEKNIVQSIRKGFKKKWKGGDDFDKKAMAEAANSPEANAINAEEQGEEQATAQKEGTIDANAATMTPESAEQNADNMIQAAKDEAENAKIKAENEAAQAEAESAEPTDEEAQNAVSGILYGLMLNGGLGEAVTAGASTAAASGFIAKIVSFFKKLGTGIKKVAGKAKNVVNKVKGGKVATKIKNAVSKVKTAAENKPIVNALVQTAKAAAKKGGQALVNKLAETKAGKKIVSKIANEEEFTEDDATMATTSKSSKILLVGGGLVAAGVVAYLLLRNRNKQQ